MKNRNRALALLGGHLLLATSFAVRAQAAPVSITPAAPAAYAPFTIAFDGFNSGTGWPINISVDSGTLVVEYAAYDSGFIPYGVRLTATVDGLPAGVYPIRVVRRVDADLTTEPTQASVTITSAGASQAMYAFFNFTTKHYFVTSAAGRDLLLSGAAGEGWIISDAGFHAWPASGPAPDAAQPVCRFYSQGANSHFYTASAAECETVKQPGSGWTYEGIAFRTLVPKNGACPSGTTPVWRLYNNRAAQNDSNHRFVASAETYRSMKASGWIGEGVVFCSPD